MKAIQSIERDQLTYQKASKLHGINLKTLYHYYPVSKASTIQSILTNVPKSLKPSMDARGVSFPEL